MFILCVLLITHNNKAKTSIWVVLKLTNNLFSIIHNSHLISSQILSSSKTSVFPKFSYWWLIRVTFVVGLVFLPQKFGPIRIKVVSHSVIADGMGILLGDSGHMSTLHVITKLILTSCTEKWWWAKNLVYITFTPLCFPSRPLPLFTPLHSLHPPLLPLAPLCPFMPFTPLCSSLFPLLPFAPSPLLPLLHSLLLTPSPPGIVMHWGKHQKANGANGVKRGKVSKRGKGANGAKGTTGAKGVKGVRGAKGEKGQKEQSKQREQRGQS